MWNKCSPCPPADQLIVSCFGFEGEKNPEIFQIMNILLIFFPSTGIAPRVMWVLGKHSTTEFCPRPQKLYVNINFWDFSETDRMEYDVNKDYQQPFQEVCYLQSVPEEFT